MFQKLENLRTGTLFILTGLAGAGKSHLAAAARKSGTIWVLDTEGAAQSLLGKPELHQDIRAVQTLSIRQLLDGMKEIKRSGKAGDTVILDSISKVLQAMRSHAAQRAGADVDKKTSLAYDEHASVNRNMQAIYTGLTDLKTSGFHVIIIGHLAKKYQSSGSALTDVGMRVLADENITYEADAILLVERTGQRRTITPIIKPPRPRHLQLSQEYPATLATLFSDQVPTSTPTVQKGATMAAPAPVDDDDVVFDEDRQPAAPAPAETATAPKTAEEAEGRFYARYGEMVGGATWAAVQKYLGYRSPKPATIQDWIDTAAEVRARNETLKAQ